MTDLDDKLTEILDYCAETFYPMHEYPDQPIYTDKNKRTLAETVAQIKQAFHEAGYRYIPKQADIQHLIDDGSISPLETGQEWYDRFEVELDKEKPFDALNQRESQVVLAAIDKCAVAARRAANIDETTE